MVQGCASLINWQTWTADMSGYQYAKVSCSRARESTRARPLSWPELKDFTCRTRTKKKVYFVQPAMPTKTLKTNPVCARRVILLVYSLSLHRHSYIGFILAFASSIHNKQTIIKGSLGFSIYNKQQLWLTLQPWGLLYLLTCHLDHLYVCHTSFVGDPLFHL